MVEIASEPSDVVSEDRQRWSTAVLEGQPGNRTSRWYDLAFDVQPGEAVLDLGSSYSGYYPENVVRLDYRYRDESVLPGLNVAARFQELPFKDESFDRALASWSFTQLMPGKDAIAAVSEALRVVRTGGILQINPASIKNQTMAGGLEANGFVTRQQVGRFTYDVSTKTRFGMLFAGFINEATVSVKRTEEFEDEEDRSHLAKILLDAYVITNKN